MRLGWHPRWEFDEAIRRTVEWYKTYYGGGDVVARSLAQITDYTASGVTRAAAV